MIRVALSLNPALCLLLLSAAGPPALAATPVELENARQGTTDWFIPLEDKTGAQSWPADDVSVARIEGYASRTSVNQGETISLFVNTDESRYQMRFYRIGWYDGAGGRELAKVERAGRVQPRCPRDPETQMVECDWHAPYALTIPDDWLSGIYLVRLIALDSGKQNYIIFVVREDDRPSDYLFLSAVNTYQAYNLWGGASLYEGIEGAATHVSFNRPYGHWVPSAVGVGDFMGWELNMVRWLEREGYDVSYATNIDAHDNPDTLFRRGALLSVGHDEYWSLDMRRHVENARDGCVSLAFFSGNSVYWQVRFAPSAMTGQPARTMFVYKDNPLEDDPLHDDGNPGNDDQVTGLFRMPRIGMPAGNPEDALLGVQYAFNPVNEITGNDVYIERPGHPLMTGITSRTIPDLVGHEADRMFSNAPPGTVRLAHSEITPPSSAITGHDNFDCDVAAGTCYSDMTVYQAPSLARVFAAGTIKWSWGLDDFSAVDGGRPRGLVDANAQQITSNVLDSLLSTGCDLDPEVVLPPPVVADVAVTVGSPEGSAPLEILRCLRDGRCLVTSRVIRQGYASVQIYGTEEMHESPPPKLELPAAPHHKLLEPWWMLSSNLQHGGKVWVVLGLDELELDSKQKSAIELLYLVEDKSGKSKWKVAPSTVDVKAGAVMAPIPGLTAIALGIASDK